MSARIPFAELFEALRDAGVAVGVAEYLAVGRLLERYDGTSRDELREMLAALLGKDEVELERIRHEFDRLYPAAPPAPQPIDSEPAPRWPLVAALAAGGVCAIAVVAVIAIWPPAQQPMVDAGAAAADSGIRSADAGTEAELATDASTHVAVQAGPQPLDTPDAPRWAGPSGAAALAYALLLVTLGFFRAADRREGAQRDARAVRRRALADLPGQRYYHPPPPVPPRPLVATDALDGVAALLGHAFHAEDAFRRDLDVRATLERTLRAGLAPVFVFQRKRLRRPLLVLRDVSREMEPWQPKVDALLRGLARRAVLLEVFTFERDPTMVVEPARGRQVRLEAVIALAQGQPTLVISDGRSVEDWPAVEKLLARLEQVAWLHPAGSGRTWPAELRRSRLRAWPLSRIGLLDAAAHLVQQRAPLSSAQAAHEQQQPLLRSDALLLQGLLSFAAAPSYELAWDLWQRFLPDAPDEVVLAAPPIVHAPRGPAAQEARAWLRERDPQRHLERAARRRLLEVMNTGRPPKGTAAYLRWRHERALHLLQMPGGDEHGEALRELGELQHTPISMEVGARLPSIQPADARLRGKVDEIARRSSAAGARMPARWAAPPLWVVGGVAATAAATVFFTRGPLPVKQSFEIALRGERLLIVDGGLPPEVTVFVDGGKTGAATADELRQGVPVRPEMRNAVVQLGGRRGGEFLVSNPLEIRPAPRKPVAPPPPNGTTNPPPAPRLPKPSAFLRFAGLQAPATLDEVRQRYGREQSVSTIAGRSGEGKATVLSYLGGRLQFAVNDASMVAWVRADVAKSPEEVAKAAGDPKIASVARANRGQVAAAWGPVTAAGYPIRGGSVVLEFVGDAVSIITVNWPANAAVMRIQNQLREVRSDEIVVNGVAWNGQPVTVTTDTATISVNSRYYSLDRTVKRSEWISKQIILNDAPNRGCARFQVTPMPAVVTARSPLATPAIDSAGNVLVCGPRSGVVDIARAGSQGDPPIVRSIDIKVGGTIDMGTVRLPDAQAPNAPNAPPRGTLVLAVLPQFRSVIRIDGKPWDQGPIERPVGSAVRISVDHPFWDPNQSLLTTITADRQSVNLPSPRYGGLFVYTAPGGLSAADSNAKIFVDGEPTQVVDATTFGSKPLGTLAPNVTYRFRNRPPPGRPLSTGSTDLDTAFLALQQTDPGSASFAKFSGAPIFFVRTPPGSHEFRLESTANRISQRRDIAAGSISPLILFAPRSDAQNGKKRGD